PISAGAGWSTARSPSRIRGSTCGLPGAAARSAPQDANSRRRRDASRAKAADADPPEYRPGGDFHRPARRALVWPHVPRRLRRRLVAGPAANRKRTGPGDAAAVRRFAVHGGTRRDPRRAAWLRAVLQAGLLPGAPARDLRGVAGRDVLPRRPAGRDPRHGACGAPP